MKRPEICDRHAPVPFHQESEDRPEGGDERQQQMRASALKLAGVIEGDDPDRAENAAAIVRSRLARRYGR